MTAIFAEQQVSRISPGKREHRYEIQTILQDFFITNIWVS